MMVTARSSINPLIGGWFFLWFSSFSFCCCLNWAYSYISTTNAIGKIVPPLKTYLFSCCHAFVNSPTVNLYGIPQWYSSLWQSSTHAVVLAKRTQSLLASATTTHTYQHGQARQLQVPFLASVASLISWLRTLVCPRSLGFILILNWSDYIWDMK